MMIRNKGRYKEDAEQYSKFLNAIINKGNAYLYPRLSILKGKDGGFTVELTATKIDSEIVAETVDSLVLYRSHSKIGVPLSVRAKGMGRFSPVHDAMTSAVGFLQAMGVTVWAPEYPKNLRGKAHINSGVQLSNLEYNMLLLEDMNQIFVPIIRK